MKIVHINAFDQFGGAARAAYRLHTGLQRMGQDSRMFVLDKMSNDSSVVRYEPPRDPWSRIRREVRRQAMTRSIDRYRATAPHDLTFFNDGRAIHGGDPWRHLPENDLVQLHWVFGFLDYEAFFSSLPRNKPIVWTMHSMEVMTGGCFYNGDCRKFTAQCGACPQLGSKSDSDLSRRIWQRKHKTFSRLGPAQLHVVTPSRWLGDEVKRSSLLGSFPCTVIPNSLDTDVFAPRSRAAAREVLGIPPDAKVILFIADGIHDPRKGLPLLVQALGGISASEEYFLVSLGPGQLPSLDNLPHLHIEPLNNDRFLSFVYSAADVFVAPSLQDNLPNTVLESIACSTPVVGFAVGGIPDLVRPGQTGLLAKPADAVDLRRAITELLADTERLKAMQNSCRRIAVEEYSLEIQARRYLDLYRVAVLASQNSNKKE
jgi:glycosyltransferase involved in cell wall biosynthesis